MVPTTYTGRAESQAQADRLASWTVVRTDCPRSLEPACQPVTKLWSHVHNMPKPAQVKVEERRLGCTIRVRVTIRVTIRVKVVSFRLSRAHSPLVSLFLFFSIHPLSFCHLLLFSFSFRQTCLLCRHLSSTVVTVVIVVIVVVVNCHLWCVQWRRQLHLVRKLVSSASWARPRSSASSSDMPSTPYCSNEASTNQKPSTERKNTDSP